ncbi:MAG: tetratricopeptide repeat protein [Bacteroidota bacterium]
MSIKNKARIVASLTVGGFIALIFLAVGCKGEYGVIEEERVTFAPAQTVALDATPADIEPTQTGVTPVPVENISAALDGKEGGALIATVDTTRKVTYKEAEAAFRERNYAEATELFTRYTQRKPENAWGYYMLGLSAKRAGDLEKSVQALQKAASIDPQHLKSWVNLGRTHMALNQPNESLAAVEKALVIDPSARDAYRIKGRAHHQLGELPEAELAYKQALALNDRDAWSMNNLAFVMIGQRKFDDALPLLARAIEINDQVAVFHNNLGMVLENKGYFRASEKAYESAVALDEGYTRAVTNKARVAGITEANSAGDPDFAALAQRAASAIKSWESISAQGGQ